MRLQIAGLLALFSLFSSAPVRAQIPNSDASRLGMEIAWQSQVQLPKVGRGIVTASLWVDASQPSQYAVVELGAGRTIKVSSDDIDRDGKPLGIEAAKVLAGERAARMLGRNDGFTVVQTNIPRIRLVVVTSDGLVQTLDAETGQTLWSHPCGLTTSPAHPASLSPAGVGLIHGRHLFLLDWASGKELMRKELKYGSSIAIALCGNLAYVSDFRGRLDAYGLGTTLSPWSSQLLGRAVGQPVSLADQSYCALASTDGFVYMLMGGDKPGIWTRYEASAAISGCLAAGNNAFYAGSGDGVLAKIQVDDRLGGLNWSFPTGEILTAPPLVVDKRVYVATESGRLHAIDDSNGFSLWSTDNIRALQPLAVVGGNLLCTNLLGEIVAVSAEQGRVVGATQAFDMSASVINQDSDRLYVADQQGRLQCLRPTGSTLPRMVQPTQNATENSEPTAEATPAVAPATGGNPFDLNSGAGDSSGNPFGGDNPFGSGAIESAPESAPGDATDPFGGAGASDPFGGSDPFGTGN